MPDHYPQGSFGYQIFWLMVGAVYMMTSMYQEARLTLIVSGARHAPQIVLAFHSALFCLDERQFK